MRSGAQATAALLAMAASIEACPSCPDGVRREVRQTISRDALPNLAQAALPIVAATTLTVLLPSWWRRTHERRP